MNTRRLSIVLTLGLLALALFLLPCLLAPGRADGPATPLAAAHPSASDILTVCLAGPPDCQYTSIQAAVDDAQEGDLVKVAAGVYSDLYGRPAPAALDHVPASGIITQVLYIDKTVTVRGGYTAPAFADPPDPEANPTTLDAQGRGRVMFISGNIQPTVEGLHITGGDAKGLGSGGLLCWSGGGGLYVLTATATIQYNWIVSNAVNDQHGYGCGGGVFLSDSPAILRENVIEDNTARTTAGGLYLEKSAATLIANEIHGNGALGGGPFSSLAGGLLVDRSPATLAGNMVTANWSEDDVGGLYLVNSDAQVFDNTFDGNEARSGSGGGVFVGGGQSSFRGNVISNNHSDLYTPGGGVVVHEAQATFVGNTLVGNSGGGMVITDGSVVTTINNLVADNHAYGGGSGIYLQSSSLRMLHNTIAHNTGSPGCGIRNTSIDPITVALTNTIIVSQSVGVRVEAGATVTLEATLWGDGAWANGTDWAGAGTIVTGTANFWGDPDFVDPAAGDYHLGPASAALDRGIDVGVSTDLDGQRRPYQAPDLGSDEYWPPGVLRHIYLPLSLRR